MFVFALTYALAAPTPEPTAEVPMTYLVAGSETSYAAAVAVAVKVADGAKIPYWSRDLVYDANHVDYAGGLTYTREKCGEVDGYPCYYPRGRVDSQGSFISIEHTNSGIVRGFTDGLYIVVVGTGTRKELAPTLEKVKAVVPDAYLKDVKVYMGCLH